MKNDEKKDGRKGKIKEEGNGVTDEKVKKREEK